MMTDFEKFAVRLLPSLKRIALSTHSEHMYCLPKTSTKCQL